MELKDKARAKEQRRAAKRTEQRTTKGPQIAWDEAVRATTDDSIPPNGASSVDTADGTLDTADDPLDPAAEALDDKDDPSP